MKIRYLLLNCFRLSGSVRSVLNQADAMAAAGHDVEIISAIRDRDEMYLPLPDRVRLTALTDRRLPDPDDRPGVLVPRAEGQYRAFTRDVENAVVNCVRSVRDGVVIGTKPGLNLLLARYGHPSATRIAQEHQHLDRRKPALRNAMVRHYPALDAVVTLTDADRFAYARALGEQAPVLVAMPNVLHRAPGAARPPRLPRRRVVLAAGRLSQLKGFDLLIDAFRTVATEHPRWRLRIYGRGRSEPDLRDRIERHHLTGRVRLMGATPALDRPMDAASLFVLSSRSEGFGMVLIEAMARGLPVISFDCPHGPAEIIRSPDEGILVPPDDVAALSAAISRLIVDRPLRRRMGAAARTRSHDFAPARVARQWELLLTRLSHPPATLPTR